MVSKKELEEKRRKDEEEAAHVFEEFIETFQQPTDKAIINKVWVKSGIVTGNKDIQVSEQSVYKPSAKFNNEKSALEQAQECARLISVDRKKAESGRKDTLKRKSNLESFKEELEQIHKDREERQKNRNEVLAVVNRDRIESEIGDQYDPQTTNLYVNNLNRNITEYALMELFGIYGPLASVKIMWPRSEEEKSRSKLYCGFVAFMSRKDAERALRNLDNSIYMDCELKVGWGKPVVIPTYPIYIPPALLELSQPPPTSGLPFNAQPIPNTPFELKNAIVKVVIPVNRNILLLIHRMVEFVVREGLLFEAMMMTREINNPCFRFLFDNQSAAHIYYRWKLFSILQGDSQKQWRMKQFRMFENGPIWQPPKIMDYTQGMPNFLIQPDQQSLSVLKKSLSTAQRDHLEILIHKLGPERRKISEVMIYCIDHSDAAEEIVDCIIQALDSVSKTIKKVISRLYLINDILYNSQNRACKSYINIFANKLHQIIKILHSYYETLENTEKEFFLLKITHVLSAWGKWQIFPANDLDYITNLFIPTVEIYEPTEDIKETEPELEVKPEKSMSFAPSRWETVDPELIESQAMTTSKWCEYMGENNKESDGKREISEERRKKLREIELIVMEYQDSLEMQKNRTDIAEQVEEYRMKLIKEYEKEENKDKKRKKKRKRSCSPRKKYSKY